MSEVPLQKRKSVYFLRTVLGTILVLGGVTAGLSYAIFRTSSEDIETYHNLMADANPTLANKSQQAPYKASQQQHQVRKDLFSVSGDDRLHLLLTSQDVNLVLDNHQGKTELTEELVGVNFFVQQNLFYGDAAGKSLSKEDPLAAPWQKMYHGTAERAFLSYKNKTFVADLIHILGYEIPGHELSETSLGNAHKPPQMEARAKKAAYDGETLSLAGEVLLENPLGAITAQEARANGKLDGKNNRFEKMTFEKDVTITLKEKGTISCQNATFDLKSLQGNFYSDTEQASFVVYRGTEDPSQKHPSILLKSRSMELALKSDQTEGSKYAIDSFLASKDVTIEYGDEMTVQSDRAIYKNTSEGLIILKGPIEIKYGTFGTLKNDQEMRIYSHDINGKSELSSIDCDGRTVLHHTDEVSQTCQWLICEGSSRVDHEKKVITFEGPRDSLDNVCAGKQVLFYDALGEAQADKAIILYDEVDGKLAVTKITLEGNVYLVDHKTLPSTESEKNEPQHYALADRVEYTPSTKEMLFSSYPGRRVLFDDKINHMQVSAPSMKITRDAQSKKESVKGIGDVRFHFLESELELLRKHSNMNF
jgi:hypothetical protein